MISSHNHVGTLPDTAKIYQFSRYGPSIALSLQSRTLKSRRRVTSYISCLSLRATSPKESDTMVPFDSLTNSFTMSVFEIDVFLATLAVLIGVFSITISET
ncbi:hypothetical protein V6N13_094325 [Hibiscus sabdariffa]